MNKSFRRLDALQLTFDRQVERYSARRVWVFRWWGRAVWVLGAIAWGVLFAFCLTDRALAQGPMIAPYEAKGYAGPVGSDLENDPATVQVLFEGRDSFGQRVQAVAAVDVDAVNLDAAFNYAIFEPNLVDTAYMRTFFSLEGLSDIDGDQVLSQVSEISGLPAGAVYVQCNHPSGSISLVVAPTPIDCAQLGFGKIDSLSGYTFSTLIIDTSTGTYPASASGDRCRIRLTWTSDGPGMLGVAGSQVRVEFEFHVGINVTSVSDCGTYSVSVLVEEWEGSALFSFVPVSSRHAFLGDVLAASAYNDAVLPVEIQSKAAELTGLVEDEEGDFFGCPDCIYPGAYDEAPVYWREGYSFAPFGLGVSSGGSSGGGFSCDDEPNALACLQTDEVPSGEVTPEERADVVVDVFEGGAFEDYIAEGTFEGYGETRTCPAPFELELGAGLGGGIVEMDPDTACYALDTYIRPFMILAAWILAGLILLRW